jgi:hypothetical protein
MFGASIAILLSAIAVWTIPANLPGTPAEGAQMVVALQGVAFIGIALIRGGWFCWKERTTIRSMFRDIVEAC